MNIETEEGIVSQAKSRTTPCFSVILCTYNRCNLVLSALASLRRQTLAYTQFEVIVIDNGSTDGTLAAVRSYVNAGLNDNKKLEDTWQVQCLSEPQNGLAYARHTGLLAASGEIAVFLDDDTIADPHFLDRLLSVYQEVDADAVGGRVEIRWEAPRPHWLSNELCDLLGYFAPAPTRIQLPAGSHFSNCNFSVKIDALRSIGYFTPFLSKRRHLPASMEVHDLCHRLTQAGYTLWYEPGALVAHRAPLARLTRAYFVGRAYWLGRSEILIRYANTLNHHPTKDDMSKGEAGRPVSILSGFWRVIWSEMREICSLALIHRPLLRLAGKSTTERLEAAMAQARSWGHVQQLIRFLEHAPIEVAAPSVLLLRPLEPDPAVELLANALGLQDVPCTQTNTDLPLSWLWRHRRYQGQAIGIVHIYRPGALSLTRRQRQRLWFRLWLARSWGMRIVTTDTGGWWQSVQSRYSLRYLSRRLLERNLLYTSDIVLGFTRQPAQLYPDKKLRRHVRCLPHPGFRGYYSQPFERTLAHHELGIPRNASFVYLCLASAHTERELLYLIEAFTELTKRKEAPAGAQLLIVGSPRDKKMPWRILKCAAYNSAVHLNLATPSTQDMPMYLGAADALVLPHFAKRTAGVLELALVGLSYERAVIAPNLPRFRGMLPPHASILYDPASRESLIQALIQSSTLHYHMHEKEEFALDAESGWNQYAHRLVKMYKSILNTQI